MTDEELRKMILMSGLSVAQIANGADVAYHTVMYIKRGFKQKRRPETIRKLVEFLQDKQDG